MLATVRPIWSELDSVSLLKEEQRTTLKDFLSSWLAERQKQSVSQILPNPYSSFFWGRPCWGSNQTAPGIFKMFDHPHVCCNCGCFAINVDPDTVQELEPIIRDILQIVHTVSPSVISLEVWRTRARPPKCALIICVCSEILPAFYQAGGVWKSLQSAASSGDKACGDKEGAPWWSTFRALTLPPRLIIIPPQSKAQ